MSAASARSDTVGPDRAALEGEAWASLAMLASRLVLHEIDGEMIRALQQPTVVEVLDKLEPGCGAYLAETDWTQAAHDDLDEEFCRLFILPTGQRPYASAWLGSDPATAGGQVVVRVQQVAASLGLAPLSGTNPPLDHLGVLLTLLANAALQEGSTNPASSVDDLFDELLEPWLPRFAERLEAAAVAPIYRALATLLAQLRSLIAP